MDAQGTTEQQQDQQQDQPAAASVPADQATDQHQDGQQPGQQTGAPPAAEGESISEMFKAEVAARAARREGREPPDGATTTTSAPPAADAGQGETTRGKDAPGQTEGAAKTGDAAKAGDGPAAARPDPWAGVDPALKKQFDDAVAERDRARSETRRISGHASRLQRDLNALQTSAPKAGQEGQRADPAASSAKPDAAEALKRIREDYPELAPALDLIEETRQAVQTQGATVGTIAEERAHQQAEREISQLAAKHQDWHEIYQSQEFADWKAANPAFGKIADTSESGAELSRIFDLYKLDTGRASPAPAADPPNPAPEGAAVKPDAGAKRALQLEASVAVSGKAPAVPTGGGGGSDGDTSALWRQEMARRRQQRQARG